MPYHMSLVVACWRLNRLSDPPPPVTHTDGTVGELHGLNVMLRGAMIFF
jgi:hypothetical protein